MNAVSDVPELREGKRDFAARLIETALGVWVTPQTVFQQSEFERQRGQLQLRQITGELSRLFP